VGKDKRGIARGHCTESECEEYESGAIRCDYCGHTPMDHVPLEPLPKRPRYDEVLTGEESEPTDEVPVTEVEDDASEGPQPERPRHDEGLKGAPTGEGTRAGKAVPPNGASVLEVDVDVARKDVDDEVGRFQSQVDDITKVRRFVISKDDGKLFAFCNACAVKIVAGKEHKGHDMFLLNQHMATASHKTNEAICLSRESEIPPAVVKIQREVEEKYPRVFSFNKTSIVCLPCNLEFSVMHKVLLSNIKQHVNSRGHKEKTGKTKATSCKDISSFLPASYLAIINDHDHQSSFARDFIKTSFLIYLKVKLLK